MIATRRIEALRTARADLTMVARLTRDLPGFLRTPISLDEARARMRHDLATRAERFLSLVERAVYPFPRSPYGQLLRHAGCQPGDLRALVQRDGLEGALRALVAHGVYLTYDELKGRRELVRGSLRLAVQDSAFDNPLQRPHFVLYSGGTRGRPSRVNRSLALVAELARGYALVLDAHEVLGARHAVWLTGAIHRLLIFAKIGCPSVGWFIPAGPVPRRVRLGAWYLQAPARLGGCSLPSPTLCEVEQPDRMVAWLAAQRRSGEKIVLDATASSAARVAVAARDAGISLSGVTFHTRSEPVSDARRQSMDDTGARVIVSYGSTETQALGYSCATPAHADDLHLLDERFAVVQRTREVGADGPTVDALVFTSLSDETSKILINAELGDDARLEQRDCDCALGRIGLRTHLSSIRSFEKLSSEGTSFVRTKLLPILETVLPRRFGGTGLDYQIVEEEAPTGATRLVLRVSSSVGDIDDSALRATLLAELADGGVVEQHHARLLERAGAISISRQRPIITSAGKVLPFHIARPGADARTSP